MTIDQTYPEYFRIKVADANSSGYPEGNFSFDVNSVSINQVPEPNTLLLVTTVGIIALGYSVFRKK